MALIIKKKSLIVICLHRDIIVHDVENGHNTRVTVPVNIKSTNSKENDEAASEDETTKLKQSNKIINGQITNIAVSENVKLIGITTHGDKQIYLFRLNDDNLKLISQRDLVRSTSAIRFTPDSKSLLVADKTGDCFLFDCETDINKPGKWIFGHFSMVLDILMTSDSRYIITSDRDEKIRITNFYQTEIIENYCLGHSEFIPSIELVSNSRPLLLSLSGDKTLRLWNYSNGKQLLKHELIGPGIKMLLSGNIVIVEVLDKPLQIAIFELIDIETNTPQIKQIVKHSLSDSIKYVNSLTFLKENSVLLACQSEQDDAVLSRIAWNPNGSVEESSPEFLVNLIRKYDISTKIELLEDVSILFKKKFDNLKDYHERKRRRIEDKLNK